MTDKLVFTNKTFEPNQTIFDEGEPAEAVYVLRSGRVEIRIGTLGDAPQTLTTVRKGDVFGELALLEKRSHQAAAVAVEKSEAVEIGREDFFKRLQAADPLMKAVVNHLVMRLREMSEELGKHAEATWEGWHLKR